MFDVQEITARELFRAQQHSLQGLLRLDILNREFGLDKQSPFYQAASGFLATDCYSWAHTQDAIQEDFELDTANSQLFILCKRHHTSLTHLEEAEQVWRLPIGT